MPPVRKLPYYTPKPERFPLTQWRWAVSGNDEVLPTVYTDWDPAVNIQAAVDVRIDVRGIYDDCRLPDEAVLVLGSSWVSSGTRLSGRGTSVTIDAFKPLVEHTLHVSIPGILLGKTVKFYVHLFLRRPPDGCQSPFMPTAVGSRLAAFVHEMTIEGIGPRFPVEVIDFASTRYPPEAGWALFWDSANLSQSVDGEIRLYINSQHGAVVRAVTESLPQDFGIREALRYDIAQQLIFGALANDDFVDSPESLETGTIGNAVFNMLRLYFPEYQISDLYSMSRWPGLFIPRLQARLRAFWETSA
jgi:hypothetical protein